MKRANTGRGAKRHPLAEKALKLDAFGMPFEFKFPDNETFFRTMPGTICTVLLAVVILIYAGYKLTVLVEKTEYSVLQETHQYHFEPKHPFDKEQGFAIAAAVSAFDGNAESIEDPTIGEVKFYVKQWDGPTGLQFRELQTKPCTENLFEKESGNGFYPLHPSFEGQQLYMPKMKCVAEPYQIWGQYDADFGANLMVVFEKCTNTPERTCKDEQTINDWMEFKYLMILQNERRYKHSIDTVGERIQEQSIVTWHALSPVVRTDYAQIIRVSEVKFQEIPYGIKFDQRTEQVFNVDSMPLRVLVYKNSMQTSVTYEFSDTKRVFSRVDYGILDWLSDIGGLYEIIQILSVVAIHALISEGPQLFVTSDIVATREDHQRKMREDQPHLSGSQIGRADSVYQKDEVQKNCCMFMRLKLGGTKCKKCCGLKVTRKDRIIFAANKEMDEDFKISNLLLKLRTLEGIVREQLSEQDWERKVLTHGLYYNQDKDLESSDSEGTTEMKSERKFMPRKIGNSIVPQDNRDAIRSDNEDVKSIYSNPEDPETFRDGSITSSRKMGQQPVKPPDQSQGSIGSKSPKDPP